MSIAKIRAWFRAKWDKAFVERYDRDPAVDCPMVSPVPPSRLVSVGLPDRGRHWHEDVEHGHTTEFERVTVEPAS